MQLQPIRGFQADRDETVGGGLFGGAAGNPFGHRYAAATIDLDGALQSMSVVVYQSRRRDWVMACLVCRQGGSPIIMGLFVVGSDQGGFGCRQHVDAFSLHLVVDDGASAQYGKLPACEDLGDT